MSHIVQHFESCFALLHYECLCNIEMFAGGRRIKQLSGRTSTGETCGTTTTQRCLIFGGVRTLPVTPNRGPCFLVGCFCAATNTMPLCRRTQNICTQPSQRRDRYDCCCLGHYHFVHCISMSVCICSGIYETSSSQKTHIHMNAVRNESLHGGHCVTRYCLNHHRDLVHLDFSSRLYIFYQNTGLQM